MIGASSALKIPVSINNKKKEGIPYVCMEK